jgi:hypothetical protein
VNRPENQRAAGSPWRIVSPDIEPPAFWPLGIDVSLPADTYVLVDVAGIQLIRLEAASQGRVTKSRHAQRTERTGRSDRFDGLFFRSMAAAILR